MSIFQKVTLQSLKKNRTRTVVTILGIVLSAAMICAVTTFAPSMQDYLLRGAIYEEGDWHGSQTDAPYSKVAEILDTGEIEKAAVLQQLGYALAEGCINEYKPYIYVLGADQNTAEMLPIHLLSGRYPASQDEILLPEHLLSNGGLDYKVGDVITLELGGRMLDGYALSQNNPYYDYVGDSEEKTGETLEIRESRTYTVVGYYERFPTWIEDFSAPGYSAITLMDKTADSSSQYSIFFKMEDPEEIYDFMEAHELGGNRNYSVLMYMGVSQYSSFRAMLTGMCAIVIGLIMFGSVSLIYNAFAISVSERTRQFGLLSSVGATKKQLRKMVVSEALAVSVPGISIGVLSGIGGIGVTLMAIGDKFSVLGYPVEMRLSVSFLSVAAAVAVSLFTVLISAWIPSRRATRISAVEAIRQNTDIKAREKKARTSKVTYRLFGLPGVLASKHYKRSRKKYRATVISLFMSIVLFVSASAFGEYLMESAEGGMGGAEYDLCIFELGEELSWEELLAQTADDKCIEKAAYAQEMVFTGAVAVDELNRDTVLKSGVMEKDGMAYIEGSAWFVNDEEFRSLLQEYDLKEADYFNREEPLAVAVDGNVTFDRDKGKYVTTNLLKSQEVVYECFAEKQIEGYDFYESYTKDGETFYRIKSNAGTEDVIELAYEEFWESYTMKSGKTIYDPPFYMGSSNVNIQLIYPLSMRDAVVTESLGKQMENNGTFFYTSSAHKTSETALQGTLIENGLSSTGIFNRAESQESSRNMVAIIKVFSYGFIVLLSLISAVNVFNTISTNIHLRRREFAMLKTVGMTQKGFQHMMNFECLLYGSRALLLGLPVSAGITYLIYRSASYGYETTFRLPWTAMGIAACSVFLVVFATMMYAMGKTKKDNLIDALKNENL